jgi:hypothetical protein
MDDFQKAIFDSLLRGGFEFRWELIELSLNEGKLPNEEHLNILQSNGRLNRANYNFTWSIIAPHRVKSNSRHDPTSDFSSMKKDATLRLLW